MNTSTKRIRRTRLVRTERYIIAVEVEAVLLDGEEADVCYEPHTVELLRKIEQHAKLGDVEWLKQHGKVYAAVEAA